MLLSSSAPPGGAKHGMAGRSTPIIRSIALADFSCWRGPRTRALTYSRRAMPYRTVPRRTAIKKEIPASPRPAAPRIIDNPVVHCVASLMAPTSVGSEIFMKSRRARRQMPQVPAIAERLRAEANIARVDITAEQSKLRHELEATKRTVSVLKARHSNTRCQLGSIYAQHAEHSDERDRV